MATPDEDLSGIRQQLESLSTEAANPTLAGIDTMTTLELVTTMNAEDARVAQAVETQAEQVAAAVDGITGRLSAGGRLIYVGAGTAGRMGILDASEIPPTFGASPDLVVGVIAGGSRAVGQAVENAEDDKGAGAEDLRALNLSAQDAVVGISASGRTPYVLGALDYARETGSFTVALANNANSAIGQAADVAIEVVVGPEFIAGSTRLKSGTAQKLVLNMLSTLTMVRLGKTYGNLMVDLVATNAKLRARSQRTVIEATGCELSLAEKALTQADGWVKLAILIVLSGTDAATGRSLLENNGGSLRAAVRTIGFGRGTQHESEQETESPR